VEVFQSDSRTWLRFTRTALLLAILLPFCLTCFLANAYNAIVAFGDSYTDTGNFPSSPPDYWNGRFSNGPLWIEDLSQSFGFAYNAANNYAVSGTESSDLGTAINKFPGTSDSANVLFAIWSGNNDFVNHLNIGYNDSAWDTQINGVVSSLMTASDMIYQKGARKIILFNQMDITQCPGILNSYSATFLSYIRGKIQTLNSRLASNISNLLNTHPGLQVFTVDIYSDFNYLLANYTSYGFTKKNPGALNDTTLSDKSFAGPGANYVFWDEQHPTAKTHGLIGGWVYNVVPAPPPPAIVISAPQNGAQFTAPSTINISASVTANGWSISGVSFFANGNLLGQVSSSPYNFSFSAGAGSYNLVAQLSYGSGRTLNSGTVQVTVSPAGSPPPSPWSHQDIGSVGLSGSAYYTSDGVFTVTGSGSDIWDTADAFQYVFQPMNGDGNIVTVVNSQQNTDGFAKAGLMFRETPDPGARNVMVFITPSFGTGLQSRATPGGTSTYVQGVSGSAPYWLKLARAGSSFTAYASADGTSWTSIGTANISMASAAYVGLAVTSHNNSQLNTSAFGQVQIAHTAVAAAPPSISIGRATNGAIQLTITGSVGASYVCEASTDLVNWSPIATNVNTSGAIQLTAPMNGAPGRGFYRAAIGQ
jgi:phospholipase/lecithinase/hemolysin